ncbi:MAG: carboxypeptidase regulatory-like domain-containing protein [Candidatus Sumerlaeia bacterium]|nr:carboxypeptidase regulatory-like domain-containing protein [Candidatus Sumerlaeia bacterium]
MQDGAPIEAFCALATTWEGIALTANATSSASDGKMTIPHLVSGRWQATLSPPSGRQSFAVRETIELPGQGALEHTFVVGLNTIRGTLLDPAGAPVAGVTIDLVQRKAGTTSFSGAIPNTRATTLDDGRFVFRNITDGTYLLMAEKAGVGRYRNHAFEIPPAGLAEPLTLRLEPFDGATIVSVTLDFHTGEPLVRVSALLSLTAERRWFDHNARRDSDGVLVIAGVPPGTYSLAIMANGYSTKRHDFTIEGSERLEFEDVLHRVGTLSVKLESADPDHYRDGAWRATPLDPNSIEQEHTGQVQPNGFISTPGLWPGRYRLDIQLPNGVNIAREYVLVAGEFTNDTISLGADGRP